MPVVRVKVPDGRVLERAFPDLAPSIELQVAVMDWLLKEGVEPALVHAHLHQLGPSARRRRRRFPRPDSSGKSS